MLSELKNVGIYACFANTIKYAIYHGGDMGKVIDKYIIIADGEIIKSYKNLKDAMYDVSFFELIYKEIKVYQQIVCNGEQVK